MITNIADLVVFQTMIDAGGIRDISTERILIPNTFIHAVQQMCEHNKETAGSLLCYQDGNTIIVESLQILGNGGETSVYFDQEKLAKRRNLLSRHPGLIAIDFHTHPKPLGSGWWDTFSQQDMSAIAKFMNVSNDYRHVLFTPTHVGTFGINKPQVMFCAEEYIALAKHAYWQKQFNNSATS